MQEMQVILCCYGKSNGFIDPLLSQAPCTFVFKSRHVRAGSKEVELLHRGKNRYEVRNEKLERREERLGQKEEGSTSTF